MSQTVELGLGGLVIGSILGGARVRTLALRVGLFLVVGVVSAVVLQTIGYAAAPSSSASGERGTGKNATS